MDPNVVAASLKANLDNLSFKDKSFASSLLSQLEVKGHLSEKQLYWLGVLEKRASGKESAAPIVKENVGEFAGVYKLFSFAKGSLKAPKINLQIDSLGNDSPLPVQIYLAGKKSKVPDVINITDGGKFGDNKWYGRVFPDGTWEQPKFKHPELGAIKVLLKLLGEKPAEVAAAYGKLTGRCCFCNKHLTDEHSTAVGYGEKCSKNYNLHANWKSALAVLGKVSDSQSKKLEKEYSLGDYVAQTESYKVNYGKVAEALEVLAKKEPVKVVVPAKPRVVEVEEKLPEFLF